MHPAVVDASTRDSHTHTDAWGAEDDERLTCRSPLVKRRMLARYIMICATSTGVRCRQVELAVGKWSLQLGVFSHLFSGGKAKGGMIRFASGLQNSPARRDTVEMSVKRSASASQWAAATLGRRHWLQCCEACQTVRREAWLQEGRAGRGGSEECQTAWRGTHPAVSVKNNELRGMSQVTPQSDGTANTSSAKAFDPSAWRSSCATSHPTLISRTCEGEGKWYDIGVQVSAAAKRGSRGCVPRRS